MWFSILFGLMIGAFIYLGMMAIVQLIKRKRKNKKDHNSIEE